MTSAATIRSARCSRKATFGSTDGQVRVYPIVCRYAWPSELDLMARVAGLHLRERWASWQREPFGPASRNCISVYER